MALAVPGILPDPLTSIRDTLASHYHRLSDPSRSLRFMGTFTDVALTNIAKRANPDIVLAIEVDGDTRGILEIFNLRNGHAEIGISVEDAYQGRGFGRALFQECLTQSRKMKLDTVDLFFSSSNMAIRKLCSDHCADIQVHGAESTAYIKL